MSTVEAQAHWRRAILSLFALLAVSAPLALAQPGGPEFRVNTSTPGGQYAPAAAPISNVWYAVTWAGPEPAGGGTGIFGQVVDFSGNSVGGEFRINTQTAGNQAGPSIASDLAGNFVVVWQSADGSSFGIFGQRFSFLGAPIGGEFRVNTATADEQSVPSIAMTRTFPAGFVVAWRDYQSPIDADVMVQRFAPSGAPEGAPFRANTYTSGTQSQPRVAASPAGFVIVWQDDTQDGSYTSVHGQRFSVTGAPQGGEFQVNTYTTGYQNQASVAMRSDGSFIVVWRDDLADGSLEGILARFYDTNGSPGAPLRVNTYTTEDQVLPAVAEDSSGRFLVSWQSYTQDGASDGVYAQRFGPTGAVEGPEFRVNAFTTGRQSYVAVAGSSSFRFLVVWRDSHGGTDPEADIYARHICLVGDADGNGVVNVTDVLYLINNLFAGGPAPAGCVDANGDGVVSVGDVLYLINYLFAGGPAPA